MADQKYFLDTNIFITPYRTYYAMDIVPSFWTALSDTAIKTGQLFIPDMVKNEIFREDDQLSSWLKNNLSCFKETASSSIKVQSFFREIADWVEQNEHYKENAKKIFLDFDCADPWIIAHAKINGGKVVTLETSDPNSKRRIKIPDVCIQFQVPYITLYSFMKEMKICI